MWLLCLAAVKPSKLPTLDAVTVAKHLWETSDLFATDVHGIVRCGPEGVPPRFRLAYMPCRNRGEILRLILEESQTAYELEVVGFHRVVGAGRKQRQGEGAQEGQHNKAS